jgi:amino acid transporter
MMELKKVVFVFLAFSLAIAVLYTPGWTQDSSVDYADQIYDLLFARPAAFLGGIGGTAVFIIGLPFTVASGGVDDSFNMFVVKPFWYAFVRKFPDKKSE